MPGLACGVSWLSDEIHLEKYRGSSARSIPTRKGENKVFRLAVACYRKRLCQRIELPVHVKASLRCPDDEDSWPHLERLRGAVVRCILGERIITLDEECVADLAESLERSRQGRCVKKYVNEIGPGCRFAPEGSRLLVAVKAPPPTEDTHRESLRVGDRRTLARWENGACSHKTYRHDTRSSGR